MGRRSQLMALAVAFVVAAAVLPATARAEDGCRAHPTGAAAGGKHWYYQTHQQTQQRCWFLGARKTALRKAAPRSFLDAMDQAPPARQMMAASCAMAPSRHASRGKHWFYQIDSSTGRKCWHLSRWSSRSVKTAQAYTPPPVLLAAAAEPAMPLPPSIADARASMQENASPSAQDANSTIASFLQPASPTAVPAEPAIHEDIAVLTFQSRWPNDSEMTVAGNGPPGRAGVAAIDPLVATVTTKGSFGGGTRILAAGPPLVDILVVFVATLGSVVILLGFLDWSFLVRGRVSPAPAHRSPLRLPKLDAEADPIAALRPDRDDMLSFFAPPAAVAMDIGAISRFLVPTV